MINLCFIKGKVVNISDYKFIYKKNKKSIGDKNICVIKMELELNNNQIVWGKGYNEMADFIYQNVKKEDIILVKGALRDNIIEIQEIEKIG